MKQKTRGLALLLTLLLVFSMAVPAYAASANPFEDVAEDAWYRDDVLAAYGTGLLTGTSATRFSPDGSLTLAEATTLAARLHQYVQTGAVELQNGSDLWYSSYVQYAQVSGLIGSEYDGRWNDDATRTEMVQIFYGALEESSYAPINRVDDNAVPDVASGDPGAAEIYTFYRAGILTGSTDGRFHPDSTIRRSEVAAILNRMLDPGSRRSFTLELAPPPDYDAPVTKENILAVLDYFDPDGAFIIRTSLASGSDSLLIWWAGPWSSNITDDLSTAVHEECHSITFVDLFARREQFYVGDGAFIQVSLTDVYDSQEMIDTIPEELRTFRFDTYLGEDASANLASRMEGAYGLLNEFTAYCWGFNNTVQTYAYCVENGDRAISNEWIAHGEFRYYILRYLLYAREHAPEVYQGILDNDAFRAAFSAIDAKFTALIEQFHQLAGPYLYEQEDYEALMAEMEKPEYQELLQLLQP